MTEVTTWHKKRSSVQQQSYALVVDAASCYSRKEDSNYITKYTWNNQDHQQINRPQLLLFYSSHPYCTQNSECNNDNLSLPSSEMGGSRFCGNVSTHSIPVYKTTWHHTPENCTLQESSLWEPQISHRISLIYSVKSYLFLYFQYFSFQCLHFLRSPKLSLTVPIPSLHIVPSL